MAYSRRRFTTTGAAASHSGHSYVYGPIREAVTPDRCGINSEAFVDDASRQVVVMPVAHERGEIASWDVELAVTSSSRPGSGSNGC